MLGYSSDELRELSLWDITYPDDRQISIDAHRELFESKKKQTVLEKRYINKQGSVVWCRLAISHIVPPGGHPAYNLTVVEDITERKALEAAEREQRALSEALYEIATVLHTTLNLPEVLEHILEQVERVVPYDSANVMLVDAAGVRMVRRRQTIPTEEGNECCMRVEDAPNLRAMQTTGEPFIIADIQADPQWENLCCAAWARSYVGVPIQSQNQIIGFLNLTSAKPNFFTPNHAQRLSMFAPQAAIAIRNAQLHQKAQELAVMEERQRLARDLHDAVTQTLFSATILVDTLPRVWEKDINRVPKLLQQLGTLNRGALSEMRILLGELRPAQLVNMKLKDLLLHVVQAAQGRTKAMINLDVNDGPPIPPDVKIATYRITQEALNNVIKHARATEVFVSYTSQASGMELVVSDNGRGFDSATTKVGLGLGSMQERASAANAHLEIHSVINQGTRVRVRWSAADNPLAES
jgi:PAS domain S-box-containing protein